MEELTCSSKRCRKVVEYHNSNEDSYYWEIWAHTMFNSKECTKLGKVTIIELMIRLSKKLLEKTRYYIKDEQLTRKWNQALEHLKIFDSELKEIEDNLENSLKSVRFKDLKLIEDRSYKLKFYYFNFIVIKL